MFDLHILNPRSQLRIFKLSMLRRGAYIMTSVMVVVSPWFQDGSSQHIYVFYFPVDNFRQLEHTILSFEIWIIRMHYLPCPTLGTTIPRLLLPPFCCRSREDPNIVLLSYYASS